MRRLAVITVGRTHSGKSTFARRLERRLKEAVVVDQDHHAAFINRYYEKLQPEEGPNTLKHGLSQFIVRYATEHTKAHLIIASANLQEDGRKEMMETFFPIEYFYRVIVYFDIPDKVLEKRVGESKRDTGIFRGDYSNFAQVLERQRMESVGGGMPEDGEADQVFVIHDEEDADATIEQIIQLTGGDS
ncbi:ATP-binding protein [Halobacillus litoralis]|uniref:AAA family ATPase n=1 Tax=Halobacillus litoralis TaxID=45668 RepID=UPI001CD6D7E6|nr:AAA family ATPase [Halobacillus litoralis]MCA0969319.1 ATP-binding protein [Halobacillus litoralis]